MSGARALPAGLLALLALAPAGAATEGIPAAAQRAMALFADHCFSPFLTAEKAAELFGYTAHDFYDLDPFSSAAPSPATGRSATPGTDRRCEISFPGAHAEAAAEAAQAGLAAEGIETEEALPAQFSAAPGTALLAARRLNPRRVAVVTVGTRPGEGGPETYLRVERLTPEARP